LLAVKINTFFSFFLISHTYVSFVLIKLERKYVSIKLRVGMHKGLIKVNIGTNFMASLITTVVHNRDNIDCGDRSCT